MCEPRPLVIHCQLLGIGADHSMVCGVADRSVLSAVEPGHVCRGHTVIDGETYQFETTVHGSQSNPAALILTKPPDISWRQPRYLPRVPLQLTGTIRPVGSDGDVLAVLPARIVDLCPSGCQTVVSGETWPSLATMEVFLTCRLPGSSAASTFQGSIEWLTPSRELHLGIHFHFSSPTDIASQEVTRWFHSQQAKLVNTQA